MVHPVYGQVRAALSDAQARGLAPAFAAEWLTRTAHGEASPATDHADALARLAWLLFVRAPALDGRYVALSPMQLGWMASGQRTPTEVVDELAKLEQVNAAPSHELDALLTTHGEPLQAMVASRLKAADRMGDRAAAATAEADVAAERALDEGRWDDVPIDGPDAAAVRTALRLRGVEVARKVLGAWREAAAAAEEDRLADALAAASRAVDAAPDLFEAWARRARYRFASGDRIGAGADLERAIALNRQAAAARAMRAELRMTIRDLQGSLEDWQAAVSASPRYAPFHIGLGYTWLAAGRMEQAVASLEAAAAIDPSDPSALLSLADIHVRRRDLPAAVATYDRILERDPQVDQALLNRGTARLMLRDVDGAWSDLTQLLERRPIEPTAWIRRAAAALQQGRPWPAWLDAITALAVAPAEWSQEDGARQLLVQAYNTLGTTRPDPADLAARLDLLRRKGTGAQVLRLADLLGEHIPAEGLGWHLLRSHAYVDYGRWADAEKAANDALAVDGQAAIAWLLLGRARLGAGRFAEALDALDAALPRAWDLDASATFDLQLARARALGAQHRLADADAAFDEALALRPERGDVWFYKGVHLDLAGQRERSVDAYTRSIDCNPTFAAAWYNRGCERAMLGQLDEATADVRQAIALEPRFAADARTDTYLAAIADRL